jgi:hypothetical protein
MAVTATTNSGREVLTAMKMPPMMPVGMSVRSTIASPALAISNIYLFNSIRKLQIYHALVPYV